jgi:hypothetical protein
MSATVRLIARDKYVYRALLDRADNVSADGQTLRIPDNLQPAGQDDRMFGVSRRNVQRALEHLKLHGWVTWVLKSQGSQGRPPCNYTLLVGSDCDCDRTVRRQDGAQQEASKAPGKAPGTRELSASVKRQTAGQAGFSLKGNEGREGEGCPGKPELLPDCAICHTPMNPVLPRTGYRTHPSCDPDEKPDQSTDPSRGKVEPAIV